MEKNLRAALRRAVKFLNENKISYALFGGIALSQWGFDRYTRDVDLKLLVPNTKYPEMRATLRKAFPVPAREHLPKTSPVVAVMIEGVIVDFSLAYPGYEELVVERANLHNLDRLQVRIATAEDLIILKIIAGRPQDLIDIQGLLNARVGKLDEFYLEEWLTQFADAMEKPVFLTQYHEFLKKAKQIVRKKPVTKK